MKMPASAGGAVRQRLIYQKNDEKECFFVLAEYKNICYARIKIRTGIRKDLFVFCLERYIVKRLKI